MSAHVSPRAHHACFVLLLLWLAFPIPPVPIPPVPILNAHPLPTRQARPPGHTCTMERWRQVRRMLISRQKSASGTSG